MQRAVSRSVLLVPFLALAACDAPAPSEPAGPAFAATEGRQILILDQCDPTSFNAVIGPGTCINRNGGITFDVFIKLLQTQQTVPSWRFSPGVIHVPREMTLPIVNAGGEVHTFTEVAEFKGGIVPIINALMGLNEVAPECEALTGADFIPSGGHTHHTFEPGQSEKYMCCIHPWMRAVTR